MDFQEMLNALIFDELERFGPEGAHRQHYNHDYFAHQHDEASWVESKRFGARPKMKAKGDPIRDGRVRMIRTYPDSYIEEFNRQQAETVV